MCTCVDDIELVSSTCGGSKPLRFLISQGMASRILLDMPSDMALELMAHMEQMEKRKVNAMLDEADVHDVATKFTEMAQEGKFAQIMGYLQYW